MQKTKKKIGEIKSKVTGSKQSNLLLIIGLIFVLLVFSILFKKYTMQMNNDYYDFLYTENHGILYKFGHIPLKVFLDLSLLPQNIEINNAIISSARSSLDEWDSRLNNIEFQITSQRENADIIIQFTDYSIGGNELEIGRMNPVTTYKGDYSAFIRISTFKYPDSYRNQHGVEVSLTHEIGHALGILNIHSNDTNDIMVNPINFNITNPSERDINTIKKLYKSNEARSKFFTPSLSQNQLDEIDSKIDKKIHVYKDDRNIESVLQNKNASTFDRGSHLNFYFEYPIVVPEEAKAEYIYVVYMDYIKIYDMTSRLATEEAHDYYWFWNYNVTSINYTKGWQTLESNPVGLYKVEAVIVDLWKQRNYTYVGYFNLT